ncbi:peptidoglycan-binding protein [Dactylosporangium sp. NBC_01737]|uniref:peptidoglycan-binding domain-containing protein n=1 Tax=Dactylosporangium sp. NBC_01737 TaxID=2975959 RepID=UPI002E10068F|nr:peptidoglycan-binding protein [Dactylosporangium sp. NBC_01737]
MNIRQRLAGMAVAAVVGVAGGLVALAEPAAAAIAACTTYRVQSNHYVPTSSTGNRNCWMQRGHKGDGVRMLQITLHDCYGEWLDAVGFPYDINADGDFGPITERALKEVQHHEGIGDDGIYGKVTAATILFPGKNAPCSYI